MSLTLYTDPCSFLRTPSCLQKTYTCHDREGRKREYDTFFEVCFEASRGRFGPWLCAQPGSNWRSPVSSGVTGGRRFLILELGRCHSATSRRPREGSSSSSAAD